MSHLDYPKLKKIGVRGVVFDKDNTITAPYRLGVFSPRIAASLQLCRDLFGGQNVLIFSNTAGTLEDPNYELAKRIEREIGVRVCRHSRNKPEGGDELLGDFEERGIRAEQIMMIGDRYTTDVLFGNLWGMLTVKTDILTPNGENFVVKTVRLPFSCRVIRSGC